MTLGGLESTGVTARELEVLRCMDRRPTNAEIAAELFISLRTVESHISSLLRKLQVSGRRDLAAMAAQLAESTRSDLAAPLASVVDPGSFHGRSIEFNALWTAWSSTANGHRSTYVVLGEAGIGKSRLVAEFAHCVVDDAPVLYGACFEQRGAAFEPMLTPARSVVTGTEDVLTPRQRDALAEHLPALGAPAPVEAAGSRSDAIDGLAALIVSSITTPTLLVLEDVHWADPSGWEAILALLRRPEPVPLMVVITSRNTTPDLDSKLARRLGDLASVTGVDAIELAGLDDTAVAALLPERSAHEVDEVLTATGGNPLFVIAQTGTGLGPLEAMLDRRFDRLSADDVDLIDIAAVIGAEFSLSLLADAAGVSVLETIDTVERAADAGIVQSHPGSPGTYAFRHALFRSLRHAKLAPRRRIEANAAVARALEERGGDSLVLARHACAGVPVIDPEHAVELVLAAGRSPAVRHDPSIAASLYGEAYAMLDFAAGVASERRLAITIRRGEALCLLDDRLGLEALTNAADRAGELGLGDLMCDAVASMVTIPGGAFDPIRSAPEFVALCRRALGVHGSRPSTNRVRVLGALGIQLLLGEGEFDVGRRCLAAALSEAEHVGDEAMAYALLSHRYSGAEPDAVPAILSMCDDMTELGTRLGHPVLYDAGILRRSSLLLFAGETDLASSSLGRLPTGGAPYTRVEKVTQQIFVSFVRGEVSTAVEGSGELRRLAAEAGEFSVTTRAVPCAAIIEAWTKGWCELRWFADVLGAIVGSGADVLSGMAALGLAGAGERERVRELAEPYVAALDRSPAPGHPLASAGLATFGLAVATADLAHLAEPLIGHLMEYSGMIVGLAYPILTADCIRADLLRASGDADAAVALARRSVEASRLRATPVFEAYELLVLAHALRDAGEPLSVVERAAAEAVELAKTMGVGTVSHELLRRGLIET